MLVKSSSWHYNLVNHKDFVSKPKDDNHDAYDYISEVWIALFVRYLVIPLVLVMVVVVLTNLPSDGSISTGRSFREAYGIYVHIFTLIITSPIWFTFLTIVFELFTKKEWRKLRVI